MAKNQSRYQLEKYDINQKIICELVDLESRVILFSIKRRAKLAEEISQETNMPLSTVYLKLKNLEYLALIYVERFELSEHGHKLKFFKSRISQAEISFKKSESRIILVPNKK